MKWLLTGLIALLFLAGCGPSKPNIVGTWSVSTATPNIEITETFKEDGTMSGTIRLNAPVEFTANFNGTYKLDEQYLTINLGEVSGIPEGPSEQIIKDAIALHVGKGSASIKWQGENQFMTESDGSERTYSRKTS